MKHSEYLSKLDKTENFIEGILSEHTKIENKDHSLRKKAGKSAIYVLFTSAILFSGYYLIKSQSIVPESDPKKEENLISIIAKSRKEEQIQRSNQKNSLILPKKEDLSEKIGSVYYPLSENISTKENSPKYYDYSNEFKNYDLVLADNDITSLIHYHNDCNQLKINSKNSALKNKFNTYSIKFQEKISNAAKTKLDYYSRQAVHVKELADNGNYEEAKKLSIAIRKAIITEQNSGLFSEKYLGGNEK